MKLSIVIDREREEEVIAYLQEESGFAERLRRLCGEADAELIGYDGDTGVKLDPHGVCCFIVEDDKTYAITRDGRYRVKARLYQLFEILPDCFVKINQSALANIRQIARFDTSISGTLRVEFKNGYTDYVSRRNLKEVKKKLGV